jgi:hypothetical protein
VFSAFATFIVFPGFIWLAPFLLKARDGSARVIGLMSAIVHRAGQHQSSGRQRLAFFGAFGAVESEQNGQMALLAANAEIPSHVGFGPSRNIQRISLRPLFQTSEGTGFLLS